MDQNQTQVQTRSLRPHAAAAEIGCGISTFWTLAKNEDFPPLIKISERVTIVDAQLLRQWRDRQPQVFAKKGGKNE